MGRKEGFERGRNEGNKWARQDRTDIISLTPKYTTPYTCNVFATQVFYSEPAILYDTTLTHLQLVIYQYITKHIVLC
jgi:hypothetical protein